MNCRAPAEYFHSVRTVTSIPSYPGSEVKFAELGSEGSTDRSNQSHVNYPTVPRSFPVIITNADGRALFNAEIKLSSNHVVTELSATTSTVSFSIDVVASLDVPTGMLLRPCLTSPKTDLCPQCLSGTCPQKMTPVSLPKPTIPYFFFWSEVSVTVLPSPKNLRTRIARPNLRRKRFSLIRPPRPMRKHWFRTARSKIETQVGHDYHSL